MCCDTPYALWAMHQPIYGRERLARKQRLCSVSQGSCTMIFGPTHLPLLILHQFSRCDSEVSINNVIMLYAISTYFQILQWEVPVSKSKVSLGAIGCGRQD